MASERKQIIDGLAARYLRPDRSRLAALRDRARATSDPRVLWAELAAEGVVPADWAEDGDGAARHGFRLTRGEAGSAPAELVTRVQVSDDHHEAVLPYPPSRDAIALFACDIPGLLDAERAARAFATRLWQATTPEIAPPHHVIWRISQCGLYHGPLPSIGRLWTLKSRIRLPGHRAPRRRVRMSRTFSWVAEIADMIVDWRKAAGRGAPITRLPSPLESLHALWCSGYGLYSLHDTAIVLFAPSRLDAPRYEHEFVKSVSGRETHQLENRLRQLARTDPDRIESMLDLGVDPNARDDDGRTPLHHLATFSAPAGHVDGVWRSPITPMDQQSRERVIHAARGLLKAGADPSLCDRAGRNPMYVKAANAFQLDPSVFVRARIDVDVCDRAGRTALHQACMRGEPYVIGVLIEMGADINRSDNEGMTPLHAALAHGHAAVVPRLIDAGAHGRGVTAWGETIYHLIVGVAVRDPDAVSTVIGQVAGLDVASVRDRHGRTPRELVSAVVPGLAAGMEFPALTGSSPASAPDSSGAVAVELARDQLRADPDDDDTWAVVGDELLAHGHPRGEIIAVELAAARGALGLDDDIAALYAIHRPGLLADLVAAHPLGSVMARDARVELRWKRGFVSRVAFGEGALELYGPALVELLACPVMAFLTHLQLDVAVMPSRLDFDATVPCLQHLTLRGVGATRVTVVHSRLRELSVELPFHRDAPSVDPFAEFEVPALETLAYVFNRGLSDPADRELAWLRSVCDRPPAGLRALRLRPVSDRVLDMLLDTPLLAQLDRLELLSCKPSLLDRIDAHAGGFEHLRSVTVGVLGMRRQARIERAEHMRAQLPRLELKGMTYRRPGSY